MRFQAFRKRQLRVTISMAITVGLVCSLLFLAACGSRQTTTRGSGSQGSGGTGEATKGGKVQISIGTASAGGTFYIIGTAMADILTKQLPNVNAVAEQTGGSVENINLLDKKELDLGMAPTAVAIPAVKGEKPFEKKMSIMAGWTLFDAPLHIVALKNSGLRTVYDLKGKKVSVGPSGSGTATQTLNVLAAHGITQKDFVPTFLGNEQAIDALSDGSIDAAAVMGSIPVPSVESLASRKSIVLLEVDPAAMGKMEALTGMPYLPTELPANTYKGQEKPVILQGAPSLIWVRPDMEEDLVYSIVKTVFANIEELAKVHPTARQFKLLTKSEAERLGVQVHPGVIKYAKEIGAWEK